MVAGESTTLGTCPACKRVGVRLKSVEGIFICDKCSSKRFSNKVRKAIQEAHDRQQAIRQQEAYRKRIELAKRGMKYLRINRKVDALKAFREYIAILEKRFGVSQGGLNLSLFNQKKDSGEILIVTGIFWDMAKIYDQMKGYTSELRYSLNKFIEFSIDRPHVILASEAIRKYIKSGKAVNILDFKDAHEVITKHLSKCFIATAAFGQTSYQVKFLQHFRDHFLMKSFAGQSFIKFYYWTSPIFAQIILKNPKTGVFARFFLQKLIHFIVLMRLIKSSGISC